VFEAAEFNEFVFEQLKEEDEKIEKKKEIIFVDALNIDNIESPESEIEKEVMYTVDPTVEEEVLKDILKEEKVHKNVKVEASTTQQSEFKNEAVTSELLKKFEVREDENLSFSEDDKHVKTTPQNKADPTPETSKQAEQTGEKKVEESATQKSVNEKTESTGAKKEAPAPSPKKEMSSLYSGIYSQIDKTAQVKNTFYTDEDKDAIRMNISQYERENEQAKRRRGRPNKKSLESELDDANKNNK